MNILPLSQIHFIKNVPAFGSTKNDVYKEEQRNENNDKKTNVTTCPNEYYSKIEVNSVNKTKFNNSRHDFDNYSGCLLGGAIGDAFGAPLEKLSLEGIKRKFNGKLHHLIKQKDGVANFTDDTQMTLFTADGLLKGIINSTGEEPDYSCIQKAYKNWYKTQTSSFEELERTNDEDFKGLMKLKELYQTREPGYTCLKSLSSERTGSIEERINNSAGNGGVMRISPIGLLYYDNPELAFRVASKSTALTHGNPRAYLSAGFIAALIANIIQGKNLNIAIEDSLNILKKESDSTETTNKIEQAIEFANSDKQEEDAIEELGSGWTGDEAVAIAIYSILKHPDNFKKAIVTSANHGGDSDTTAAITGNIIGALNGKREIPTSWANNIEMKNLLNKYAMLLYANSQAKSDIDKRQNEDKIIF